jgi:hypothetical protein
MALFDASRKYNVHGKRELGTIGSWLYVWQLLGVGLVIWRGISAWHLVWWFAAGFVLCFLVGKILMRLGHDPA